MEVIKIETVESTEPLTRRGIAEYFEVSPETLYNIEDDLVSVLSDEIDSFWEEYVSNRQTKAREEKVSRMELTVPYLAVLYKFFEVRKDYARSTSRKKIIREKRKELVDTYKLWEQKEKEQNNEQSK